MQTPWKKFENQCGFPFYSNENTQQKQWDHPKFIEVKNAINECNYVKYSKYRVAFKFRALQRKLFMEEVSLDSVLRVFDKHKLGVNESSLCLESYDLEAVLVDIYFASLKEKNTNFDLGSVELMQNFLFNVYDKNRLMKMQVSSVKLVLALLSECKLSELYNLIFSLCADHNNCVTRLRLQCILSKIVDILVFMHEDVSFGQHLINSTIENCFSNSPGLVGVCEDSFILWLKDSPHLLSWIPILFRIRSCETVIHNVRCSTCKTDPMQGLMYRCTKCFKYTQCQRCFLMGRVNNSHKLYHSMREYCAPNETPTHFKFIKKLRGFMHCSRQLEETDALVDANFSKDHSLKYSTNTYFGKGESPTSPQIQLHFIIRQLELQTRELQKILYSTYTEKEIKKHLEVHKFEVEAQIYKLKILREQLRFGGFLASKKLSVSTPTLGFVKYPCRTKLENVLSPIAQIQECNERPKKKSLFLSADENSPQNSITYSVNDISSWIKDHPTSSNSDGDVLLRKSPVAELHNDLDEALAKLQQILANNFTLDESLGTLDNDNLKHAVSEMEGMLTSFIDNVESNRTTSLQPFSQ